jgi:hypothetical protein
LSGPFAPGAFVLAAALAASSAAFADSAAAPPAQAPAAPAASSAPKASETKPADLKEALSRLAAAATPVDYAAMLDSFSTSLPPSDALALLDQGVAGARPEYRRALLVKAADLDLLLGLFEEAASRYEAAAGAPPKGREDPALLLRSARCSIAAGDAEKAQALAADVVMTAGEPDLVVAARLVSAWAFVMRERPDEASALASSIAGAAKGGPSYPSAERRREARFILWLCAEAGGRAAAAASLASEFPGSPEALIAAGSASAPPLPHWYLGGFGPLRSSAAPRAPTAAAAPASAPPQPPPTSVPAAAPSTSGSAASVPAPAAQRGKRLQVGFFSREDNAQALKAELSSKGFAAAIETRTRAAGSGKAEEKRWIVVVDGGKDIAATLQSLKDSGYESYVID